MKIAMMTNNYKPFIGGVPISIERLSEGLRTLGHEVYIFAPEYEPWRYEQDVIRYRTYERKLKNGMVIPDISDRCIRDEFVYQHFDVIHVHHPMLIGNAAMHLSRKYNVPLIFTYHTRYEEYLHYLKPFEKGGKICEKGRKVLPKYLLSYAKKCDLVYAPSGQMGQYLRNQGLQTPVQVLPTGLSRDAYVRDENTAEKIRRKYAKGKPYLLCTVSRLEKEKNLYFLLEALSHLKAQMGDRFHMLFVGDGAEKKSLSDYAESLGIADALTFTGLVDNDDVKHYLAASDLFLFSSKSETQGIVLAEAMAAGVPVTAVSACGVCDIVKDGENGYMTGENVEEYADRVQIIMENTGLRKHLQKGALKTAENYRMEYIAKQAEEGYELAVERRRSHEYAAYEKNGAVSSLLRLFKVS